MANKCTSFSIHNILNRGSESERNTCLDEDADERANRDREASDSLSVRAESAERRISSCVLVLDSSSSDQHSCEEESTGEDTSQLERRHGETIRQPHRELCLCAQAAKTPSIKIACLEKKSAYRQLNNICKIM